MTTFLISGRPRRSSRIGLAAARDEGLRDRGDQRRAVESLDDRRKRNLDDDRQDVAILDGVRGRVEGELARQVRADRGLDVHEERVARQSREDAHAVLLERLADDEARLAPVRGDDVPFLRRPFRRVVEGDVDACIRPCRA